MPLPSAGSNCGWLSHCYLQSLILPPGLAQVSVRRMARQVYLANYALICLCVPILPIYAKGPSEVESEVVRTQRQPMGFAESSLKASPAN